MWVVKKDYHDGLKRLIKIREIPHDIVLSLKNIYKYNIDLNIISNHKNNNSNIIDYLTRIRNEGNWITCDCNIIDVYKPVVMTICCKDDMLYFSKVHSFNDHMTNCPFFRIPNNIEEERENIREMKPIEYFGMYKKGDKISQNNDSSTDNNSSKGTKNEIGKLGRRMFTLLEKANLNQFNDSDFYKNNYSVPYLDKFKSALSNEISNYKVTPNIELKECFMFRQNINFNDLYLLYDNLKILTNIWHKNYERQGFVLFLTDKIVKSEKSIEIDYPKPLIFKNEIKFVNGIVEKSENPGPFLVLMTVLYNEYSKNKFDPYDVFCAPVVSKNILIPIESNYERIVLNKLITGFKRLKSIEIEKSFKIIKPLFDIKIDNERCRPDFILKMGDKTLILEVMGFENDEYFERKKRTHKVMEKIGTVLTFNCKNYSNNDLFSFELDELITDLFRINFNKNFNLSKYNY